MKSVAPLGEENAQLIRSWSEVAAAIRYERLSTARQLEARDEFFKIVIQPQVDPAELDVALQTFEHEVAAYLQTCQPDRPLPVGVA